VSKRLDWLPEFFLDRSLGRIQVPGILRAAGVVVTTLSDHYGVPADEKVRDTEWLELAGSRGWAVLMADSAIAKVPAEVAVVLRHGVKCFTVPPRLQGHRQAGLILWHLNDIAELCAAGGPFIYSVEPTRLRRLDTRN
jgi:hypothetical protein